MWRKDGTKLSGYYGTWNGREFELEWQIAIDGVRKLIQEGGNRPGPEWRERILPNRFARPLVKYSLEVPECEVVGFHAINATGVIDDVKVVLIAESESGMLAIESDANALPGLCDELVRKYGSEYYDDRRSFAYGWVPAEHVHDITIERREISKDRYDSPESTQPGPRKAVGRKQRRYHFGLRRAGRRGTGGENA